MNPIDFVILWVDDTDIEWQKRKAQYSRQEYNDNTMRFRDWGLLPYWFRGVEEYAPWVRKIHFVTEGHLPKWLNVNNPKLHIVKHSDFMPEDTLPTFNSNAIEIYLNRVQGLSENFVLFNDDCYIVSKVEPEYFFVQGKPRDMLALQPVVANPGNPTMTHIFTNNSLALSRHFTKFDNMASQKKAYFSVKYPLRNQVYNRLEKAFPKFTGFYTQHGPSPFLKSVMDQVWEEEKDALNQTGHNRFRSDTDVSQYLFREWQKLSGEFVPANIEKDFSYFEAGRDDEKIVACLSGNKIRVNHTEYRDNTGRCSKKVICINDAAVQDFDVSQAKLLKAFNQKLPNKCSFEI